jgi:hypothetical protein
MSDNQPSDNENALKPLRFEEYLSDFMDFISSEYQAQDMSLYRWSHHPMTDDDDLPQIFQVSDPRSVDDMMKPDADAPEEVKREYVSHFTYSCFDTPENAIKRFTEIWSRLKPKRQGLFVEQKGAYVTKVVISKENAIKDGTQANGHTQILLREGVHIQDLVDDSFVPIKIELL